jgi:uncharacterized membrane protein SpoIIM required for sporulation
MQVEQFVHDRSLVWGELEHLLDRASGQPAKLAPAEIRRLGVLYRAAAADLALAVRSWPDAAGTLRLHGLVVRANQVVYSKAAPKDTFAEYLSRRLWQRIRQLRGCLALSAAILLGSLALGILWGAAEPSAAVGLLPAGFHVNAHTKGSYYGAALAGRGGLVTSIWVNNMEVSVLAVAGGFTGGLVTAWFLAYNGAIVGVLGALEWRAGGLGNFLSLTVPHGLLELSCIAIAGGVGFVIAKALIDPGASTRAEALQRVSPIVGSALASAFLFLLVAATTEGIVTPWDLPTPAAFAVGLVLAGGFWAMVIWRGGAAPAASARRREAPKALASPTDGLSASA